MLLSYGHIRRVQRWAVELASRLGLEDGTELSAIEAAALLHDIGKLAVPEQILNKPGSCMPVEFERMKTLDDGGCGNPVRGPNSPIPWSPLSAITTRTGMEPVTRMG